MSQIEKTVFISYRRTNIFMARAVYASLTQNGYDVYLDFDSIHSGDFGKQIMDSIASRAHFLVILTPSSLERCRDPEDWVRQEIEHAVNHKRNVIPLFFDGFQFEDIREYLPDHLSEPLSRYNALRVPSDYFDEAMARLRDRFLNIPLDLVAHPDVPKPKQYEDEQTSKFNKLSPVTKEELAAEEWFEQGYKAIQRQDYNKAMHYLNEALRRMQNYAQAYFYRGNAYYALGDLDAAIDDFNQVIRLHPPDADVYYDDGSLDRIDVVKQDEMPVINGQDAYAYLKRGRAFHKRGELISALQDYQNAIQLQPDLAEAFISRGAIHYAYGNLDAAIHDYTKTFSLQPDFAQTTLQYQTQPQGSTVLAVPLYVQSYINRGNAYFRRGDYTAATGDFNEVTRLHLNEASADTNQGNAYVVQYAHDQLTKAELLPLLEQALRELSFRDREIAMRRLVHKEKSSKLAARFGITTASVSQIVSRAKNTIRGYMRARSFLHQRHELDELLEEEM